MKRSSCDEDGNTAMSKNAQKKLERKRLKKQKKEEFLAALREEFKDSSSTTAKSHSGGKASRARQARNGIPVVGSRSSHRANGGAPVIDSTSEHCEVLLMLEDIERKARKKFRPGMEERKDVPMDNHGSMEAPRNSHSVVPIAGECNMSERSLRSFAVSLIPSQFHPLMSLTSLDLSRNELWTLPELSSLPNLAILDLSRNWFQELPESISQLSNLTALRASHNMLRSSRESLQIEALKSLPRLRELDITFNRKCGNQSLADQLAKELPSLVTLKTTVSFPRPENSYVGESAFDRDPTLLRSQLEPWSTTALRRRLVADFGGTVLPPEVPRGEVMKRLLSLYNEEEARAIVTVEGEMVEESFREELLVALRAWSLGWADGNEERTTIKAENYMILTSPQEYATYGSSKAKKASVKLEAHKQLWDLAQKAVASVDSEFATKYTAVAVTHGFQGSPHIDRQNVGPFYGLALGDFDEGTGEIMVECSARVVAKVNTRNRLGKVDGRFPHWVAPYDLQKERYSLIFYRTAGEIQSVGPAVFKTPI